MREWALWAVRNMCEISAEAQETIKCVRVTGSPLGKLSRSATRCREMEAQTIPSMD